MSVYLWTGINGSGKTYNMVKSAYKAWKKGVNIYSNIPLLFNKTVSKKRLNKCGKLFYFNSINEITHVTHAIILFDEAQVLFSGKDHESIPRYFSWKIQQQRKHFLHLYATTQHFSQVFPDFRKIIEYWFHCETRFRLGTEQKEFIGIHALKIKDMSMTDGVSVIEPNIPDTKIKNFMIGLFSKRIYDTLFDIGFEPLRTIWYLDYLKKQNKSLSPKMKVQIISR